MALLYHRICLAAGGDVACVRTPNTLTMCRSWPERHVQLILLTMQKPSHHLLFADLDCTAVAYMGGEVFTTSRSRRALETGRNLVPHAMLRNRRDMPPRIAAYQKGGSAQSICRTSPVEI